MKWYDPDDYANNLIKDYNVMYNIKEVNICGWNMNKKKIIEKITELQKAVLWLELKSDNNKTKTFYLEHLGPIYRVLSSLKKEIK